MNTKEFTLSAQNRHRKRKNLSVIVRNDNLLQVCDKQSVARVRTLAMYNAETLFASRSEVRQLMSGEA